ncbi:SpoIIIAH-like family protein [Shimazuella sp. AN120528]|uniref:SpoIIIAH-like family protein n=1 Tax=Shimazuella soli TaxID=1892854 RepID=UPI001F0E63F0|nr:SpoIIIAH-like family protein [Shimazuella soli]MCH5584184.1 SpoIIIAH-like family protein [Shimazuella soli]
MTMNRQTMWLVTMLTLMVVLSAYYIVTGPDQPAGPAIQSIDEMGNVKSDQVQVDIKSLEKPVAVKKETSEASDYFVSYHMQRNATREKQLEGYYQVLMNPTSTKQELETANAKIEAMNKLDKAETTLEEQIREAGFQDVVVMQENDHVNIIVQSKDLSRKKAVEIITMAQKQMQVAASQISVAYKA